MSFRAVSLNLRVWYTIKTVLLVIDPPRVNSFNISDFFSVVLNGTQTFVFRKHRQATNILFFKGRRPEAADLSGSNCRRAGRWHSEAQGIISGAKP